MSGLPPWPTLHRTFSSEADALAALAALEGELGPLPQAELIEPWESEGWSLRIELPNLTEGQAEAIQADGAELRAGQLPGARAARDLGRAVPDFVGDAVLWSDAVDGGLLLPDLIQTEGRPEHVALAHRLIAAIQGVSPELVPDALAAISHHTHRSTGRLAIGLHVPADPLDRLNGEELAAVRLEIMEALRLVVPQADLAWDPRSGVSVYVFVDDVRGTSLPGDGVVDAGVHPPVAVLLASNLGQRCASVEVQALLAPGTDHEDMTLQIAEALAVVDAVGGEPRWVASRINGSLSWLFCPTWMVDCAAIAALSERLQDVGSLLGVHALRVVPASPLGLETEWPYMDPAWWWVGRRWCVRWHDGLRDRDRLVAWKPEEESPEVLHPLPDLMDALRPVSVIASDAGEPIRRITDDVGNRGFAVHIKLPPDRIGETLAWVASAVGRLSEDFLTDVVDVGVRGDVAVFHLWCRRDDDVGMQSRTWVTLA